MFSLLRQVLRAFIRQKPIDKQSDNDNNNTDQQLKRCLGPIDLTALGELMANKIK